MHFWHGNGTGRERNFFRWRTLFQSKKAGHDLSGTCHRTEVSVPLFHKVYGRFPPSIRQAPEAKRDSCFGVSEEAEMVSSAREKSGITVLFFRGCVYIQQRIKKKDSCQKGMKQIKGFEFFNKDLPLILYIILYLSYETLHYLMHKKFMIKCFAKC